MTGILPVVFVPRTLLDETGELLASFALRRPSEGVVYWFGMESAGNSVVTSLIVPNADTSGGAVKTSPTANAEAQTAIVGTPLVLLGQAHSHPGRRVRHSGTDDRDTFAQFPGAISLVVPYYGRRGVELARCGVHRHIDGQYRWIKSACLHDHLQVLPGVVDFRRPKSSARWGDRNE